jgi:hypothetical protein
LNRRIVVHLAAMLLLGAAAFAGFAALVQWRHGQPVEVPTGIDTTTRGVRPGTVLARGLAASALTSRRNLASGDRGHAMDALDAARRDAEVGLRAVDGELQWAVASAYDQVRQARTAIQVGSASGARTHLRKAAATMQTAATRAPAPRLPPRRDWDNYHGATLLNALGVRIGEFVAFTDDGNGNVTAKVRVGGQDNVLGFIDIGGSTTTVRADRLLYGYGEPRIVGEMFVVAPTFGDSHEEVALAAS